MQDAVWLGAELVHGEKENDDLSGVDRPSPVQEVRASAAPSTAPGHAGLDCEGSLSGQGGVQFCGCLWFAPAGCAAALLLQQVADPRALAERAAAAPAAEGSTTDAPNAFSGKDVPGAMPGNQGPPPSANGDHLARVEGEGGTVCHALQDEAAEHTDVSGALFDEAEVDFVDDLACMQGVLVAAGVGGGEITLEATLVLVDEAAFSCEGIALEDGAMNFGEAVEVLDGPSAAMVGSGCRQVERAAAAPAGLRSKNRSARKKRQRALADEMTSHVPFDECQ